MLVRQDQCKGGGGVPQERGFEAVENCSMSSQTEVEAVDHF